MTGRAALSGSAAISGSAAMSGSPSWWLWAGLAAVFCGLLVLLLVLLAPLLSAGGGGRIAAIDGYVGGTTQEHHVARSATPSALGGQVLELSERLTRDRSSTARTALLLTRADVRLRTNEWYVLRVVAVAVTVAGFLVLLHGSFLVKAFAVLLGAGAGLLAPVLWLRFVAARRASRFERQLPDVLTLVASSLATGFSLAQAIDAIVTDAAEPSAKEFARALAETRIGAEIEDSLERLAERMGSQNLEWTTMAVRIQRQVGGNLAETLRTTAGTLRDREALYRQVRGLSAEGRLSAYILIGLPVGVFLYMLLVNRPYVALLWTTGLGLLMSAGGLVSLGIGVVWMRKVVQVEV